MKNTGWIHPIDTSDQWDGFNESGMEHFTGSPIRHLAREVTQNSLDSKSEHGNGCVQVRIRKRIVKVNEIPGIDELKATFKLCGIAASTESEKAAEFFQVGLKELSKTKINILEIDDFNTKGIRGPAKNGSPYYAFMKAKGQSKKESATAGGSFGIGKFAPYAVSKLRTVFVSTVFSDDDGEFKQLTQGKSILMSHDGSNGARHQGIGFWGVAEKCNPVEDEMDKLPSWLTRCPANENLNDHVGTKLTILGFDDIDGWQKSLAVTLAENFFGAINEGSLEINIDGAFELNATTLDEVFENEELMEHIENDKNEPDQYINSHHDIAPVFRTP